MKRSPAQSIEERRLQISAFLLRCLKKDAVYRTLKSTPTKSFLPCSIMHLQIEVVATCHVQYLAVKSNLIFGSVLPGTGWSSCYCHVRIAISCVAYSHIVTLVKTSYKEKLEPLSSYSTPTAEDISAVPTKRHSDFETGVGFSCFCKRGI